MMARRTTTDFLGTLRNTYGVNKFRCSSIKWSFKGLHWLNIFSVQWDYKKWPSWQSGPGCDKLWIVNVWYFQDCWCIIHVSVYNPGVLAPVIYQLMLQDCIKGSRHKKSTLYRTWSCRAEFQLRPIFLPNMGLYFSDKSGIYQAT